MNRAIANRTFTWNGAPYRTTAVRIHAMQSHHIFLFDDDEDSESWKGEPEPTLDDVYLEVIVRVAPKTFQDSFLHHFLEKREGVLEFLGFEAQATVQGFDFRSDKDDERGGKLRFVVASPTLGVTKTSA